MALLNLDTDTTLQKIEDVGKTTNVKPRNYLGMSQLGHNCERFLNYYFRHCFTEDISAQSNRIFRTGHKAEDDMIADLKAAGITVYGEQDEYSIVSDHCRGHNDGIGIGFPEEPDKPHIIEFKTSNDTAFKKLLKEGVKVSKPMHYDQMTLYAHLKDLDHAMYMVLNKNTSQYYVEQVTIDHEHAKSLIEKADRIITQETLPQKIGGMSWFECKWCSAYDICQLNKPITPSCRNCKFVSIEEQGQWKCLKTDQFLDQYEPCGEYQLDQWLLGENNE